MVAFQVRGQHTIVVLLGLGTRFRMAQKALLFFLVLSGIGKSAIHTGQPSISLALRNRRRQRILAPVSITSQEKTQDAINQHETSPLKLIIPAPNVESSISWAWST